MNRMKVGYEKAIRTMGPAFAHNFFYMFFRSIRVLTYIHNYGRSMDPLPYIGDQGRIETVNSHDESAPKKDYLI